MNFAQPVYIRPDGTFVVQYNNLPYHVTSDPTSAVKLSDVQAWATANPTLVSPDPGVMSTYQKALAGIMSLSDYQSYAYAQIDGKVQALLATGVSYLGLMFPCAKSNMDYLVQLNIGVMTGMKVLPYTYDLGSGDSFVINSSSDLTALNVALGTFEQTTMQSGTQAKANVKAATTAQAVQTAYQAFTGV